MIIITGGSGFIGSNLLAEFSRQYKGDIVLCDILGNGDKWRNLSKHRVDAFIYPEQLLPFIENNPNKIEGIFHLGAISSTTEKDVDLIIKNNIQLSSELWHLTTLHQIRFIYASSAATYGDGSAGFDDKFNEPYLSQLRPLNPYGWSKHVFDRFVWREVDIYHRKPPQWAGLKFFNVYGPNEYHKDNQKSVVASLFPQIQSTEKAKLFKSYHPSYTDGGQLRDFVYVADCVKIMLWLFANPHISGLFNVGTGKARSFQDLASEVFKALNLAPNIEFIDMPETLKDKYQYYTQANIDKLLAAGYTTPMTSLEEGIKEYVQTYLTNDDPYQ
ncbi:MAG: ADP-glyceromanno-heptose 6-epimerase [Alphaproteobacteria bacterium]|nr:ADP-glyceromanno-heptose 6-epimerase [Alphaproteobacteria bacterium]OJV46600.1 MAG: ADP-glyceromanno-heptose 6-epimerase [Alphaproteobacteria bacterium 43-37]